MDYLGMSKVLELIDEKYDYGQDEESKGLMATIPENYVGKHLIGRKTVLKYMSIYAKEVLGLSEWDNYTYLEIIETNDKNMGAQKYSKESILEFLENSNVKKKLQSQIKEKTVKMNDSCRLPKCILPAFIKQCNSQAEEDEILRITGYTKRQVDLWSVPFELLAERKAQLEAQIAEPLSELEDINEALKN